MHFSDRNNSLPDPRRLNGCKASGNDSPGATQPPFMEHRRLRAAASRRGGGLHQKKLALRCKRAFGSRRQSKSASARTFRLSRPLLTLEEYLLSD